MAWKGVFYFPNYPYIAKKNIVESINKEIEKQQKIIKKYEALIEIEIRLGKLMNVKNVKDFATKIKKAHRLIETCK